MIALDTGVLLAAEGFRGPEKWQGARDMLVRLPAGGLILPAQALAEMLHVLKSAAGQSDEEAGVIVARWLAAGQSADIGPDTIAVAQDMARQHKLPLADALILASASGAGAALLISDDIAEDPTSGVEIINPFTPEGAARLDRFLGSAVASA